MPRGLRAVLMDVEHRVPDEDTRSVRVVLRDAVVSAGGRSPSWLLVGLRGLLTSGDHETAQGSTRSPPGAAGAKVGEPSMERRTGMGTDDEQATVGPLGDQMRGHGVRHADPDSDAPHPVPRRRVEADALSGSPGPVLQSHHGVEQGIPDDHRGGRDRDRECDVVERARSPADSCQARPVSAIFGRPRRLVPNSTIGIVGTCPSRSCRHPSRVRLPVLIVLRRVWERCSSAPRIGE